MSPWSGRIGNKNSEAIDAIGFMLFYNQDYVNEKLFKAITETMNRYLENNIMLRNV